MEHKNEKGIEVTVYRITKSKVYMVDPNGHKYATPPIPGMPYHVGMRLSNVIFKATNPK